jgi:protein-S-isoprenylcysteine O-methyltransferase
MATRRGNTDRSGETSSANQQFERGTYIERDGLTFEFPPGTICPGGGEGDDYFDLLSCLSNPRVLDTPIQFKHDLAIGRAAVTGLTLGFLIAAHIGGLMWAVMSTDPHQQRSDHANALILWCTYFVGLCLYHLLEFLTTARYNPGVVSNRSFLITQSDAYTYALLASWVEFMLEVLFVPQLKGPAGVTGKLIFGLGVGLMVMGQAFRSGAMVTAKSNFTHLISVNKVPTHKLVTDGVYSYLRHPSYFGWFWWSIATQVGVYESECVSE